MIPQQLSEAMHWAAAGGTPPPGIQGRLGGLISEFKEWLPQAAPHDAARAAAALIALARAGGEKQGAGLLGLGAMDDKLLQAWGEYAKLSGKAAEMEAPFKARLEECRIARDRAGEARALYQLGRLEEGQGNYSGMRSWLGEALALNRSLDHKQGIQDCLNRLADSALRQGDYATAEKWSEEFLAAAKEHVDKGGLVWSELRMAELEMFTGRLEMAIERLKTSLALTSPSRDRWTWAYFNNKVAEALLLSGKPADAQKFSTQSLAAFEGLGDAWGKAWASEFLGFAHYLGGKPAEAAPLLDAAVETYRHMKNRASLAAGLCHATQARLSLAGPEAAWPLAMEALNACLENGYASAQSEGLAVAAACLHVQGKKLSEELALYLTQKKESSFAAKETLKRHQVKAGPRLFMLADKPGRPMDFPGAIRYILALKGGGG